MSNVSLPEIVLLYSYRGSEYVLKILKKTATMKVIVKTRDPISEIRIMICNSMFIPKQEILELL